MSESDKRTDKRYPFRWRAAIVFDGSGEKDAYRGVTKDISLGGCAVLTEHNVFSERPVTVLISPPPDNPHATRIIIEAKGRMVYTVFSAGHGKFRCGIQFTSFKSGSRAVLNKALVKRDISL